MFTLTFFKHGMKFEPRVIFCHSITRVEPLFSLILLNCSIELLLCGSVGRSVCLSFNRRIALVLVSYIIVLTLPIGAPTT